MVITWSQEAHWASCHSEAGCMGMPSAQSGHHDSMADTGQIEPLDLSHPVGIMWVCFYGNHANTPKWHLGSLWNSCCELNCAALRVALSHDINKPPVTWEGGSGLNMFLFDMRRRKLGFRDFVVSFLTNRAQCCIFQVCFVKCLLGPTIRFISH